MRIKGKDAALLLAVATILACVSQPVPWVPEHDVPTGSDTMASDDVKRGFDVDRRHDLPGSPKDGIGADDAIPVIEDGTGVDWESEDSKDIWSVDDLVTEETTLQSELKVIWEDEFGAPAGNDSVRAMVQSYNGDFITCGYSNASQTGGNEKLTIRRYKQDGDFLWETKEEMAGTQLCQSIVEIPTGEVLVTGRNTGIIKFDFFGKKTWAKDDWYPGNGSSMNKLMLTKNGDLVVVGYLYNGSNSDGFQGIISRLSFDGSLLWDDEVGDEEATSEERLKAVVELPNGDLLAAGYRSNPQDGKDALLVGYSADGNKEFEVILEREFGNWVNQMVHSGDGYLYILGGTNGVIVNNHTQAEVWLAKMAYGGSIIWEKAYKMGKANSGLGLVHRLNGGLLLSTSTATEPTAQNDCRVIATDYSGSTDWEFYFATEKNELCSAIVPLVDDGFVVGGHRSVPQQASQGWISQVGWTEQ